MKPEDRIRNRKSYQLWSDLALFLKKRPGIGKTLWRLFWLLNNGKAFGSERAAYLSYQSLRLLCEDASLRPFKEANPFGRELSD